MGTMQLTMLPQIESLLGYQQLTIYLALRFQRVQFMVTREKPGRSVGCKYMPNVDLILEHGTLLWIYVTG
jgi:hypothetical protein